MRTVCTGIVLVLLAVLVLFLVAGDRVGALTLYLILPTGLLVAVALLRILRAQRPHDAMQLRERLGGTSAPHFLTLAVAGCAPLFALLWFSPSLWWAWSPVSEWRWRRLLSTTLAFLLLAAVQIELGCLPWWLVLLPLAWLEMTWLADWTGEVLL